MTLSFHDNAPHGNAPLDEFQGAELARLRGRIDAVDRRLLALLARRGELVQLLAALKRCADSPMLDPVREADLVAELSACDHAPYTDEEVEAIWREVLAASHALMQRDG